MDTNFFAFVGADYREIRLEPVVIKTHNPWCHIVAVNILAVVLGIDASLVVAPNQHLAMTSWGGCKP
jgi:hypothetical protein